MRSAPKILFRSIAALFCASVATLAAAQQLPSAEAIQRALQGQNLPQQSNMDLRPNVQVYQPTFPDQLPLAPPSRLEALYSERASQPLTQFGYDMLGIPSPVSVGQVGAVQENYVLGEGDEVVIVTRGQDNETYRQRVNRDGQIVLPRLNPIGASGRTFGQLRQEIMRQVAGGSVSTSAFVTLGEVRQISVLVTGEVRAPGLRIMSAFSTPLDALLLSGGIAKTGSLRYVTVLRGNQQIPIDLYGLLLQGNVANLSALQNGDRVFVPALKNTVAVTGYVRRPGIYELRGDRVTATDLMQFAGGIEIGGAYRFSKMRLEANGSTRLIPISQTAEIVNGEVLFVDPGTNLALERVRLAGAARIGAAFPRSSAQTLRQLLPSVDSIGMDAYTPFAVVVRRDPALNVRTLIPFSLVRVFTGQFDLPLLNDDMVYVFNNDEIRVLSTEAARARDDQGRTIPQPSFLQQPGQQQQQPGGPGALPQPGGLPQPGQQQPPGYGPANPMLPNSQPMANGANPPIASDSFTNQQNLRANGFQQPTLGGQDRTFEDLRLQAARQQLTTASAAVAQAAAADNRQLLNGRISSQQGLLLTPDSIALRLGVSTPALVRTVGDHLIWVLDEVRDPGPYVAGEGTTLREIVQTAGGLLRGADLSVIEVTSTQIDAQSGRSTTMRTDHRAQAGMLPEVMLQPLDTVRFRRVFSDRETGRITILGQVRYPGTFDMTRGEKLSSLLERAGGLTPESYPIGAVFTRERTAIAEREGHIRQAREIEAQLATFTATPADANEKDRLAFLTTLAQRLRDEPVLGRIGVTADPAILRVKPELDIMVEPGDTLYIPLRPSSITVSGEVLNQGSFQYGIGLTAEDYIEAAGGFSQSADRSRVFVVLPDGSAQPVSRHWLSFDNSGMIPPGTTIIVPRDLRPFDFGVFFRDATQIASQLAITAASLAIVGR